MASSLAYVCFSIKFLSSPRPLATYASPLDTHVRMYVRPVMDILCESDQTSKEALPFAGGMDSSSMTNPFSHGTVHRAGDDLQTALKADFAILALWEKLTPLGRNEFICWVDDAKQPATRQRRIVRTREELLEGKKRPCCWVGCIHRTDKAPSPWQQAVLIDKKQKPAI